MNIYEQADHLEREHGVRIAIAYMSLQAFDATSPEFVAWVQRHFKNLWPAMTRQELRQAQFDYYVKTGDLAYLVQKAIGVSPTCGMYKE